MFCPKCGYELSTTPNGLFCQNGKMEITKDLEKRLYECYVHKSREPHTKKFDISVGGQWFCPQCGGPIIEEEGILQCPNCKLSINEFIFSLIEHHVHFDGQRNYY